MGYGVPLLVRTNTAGHTKASLAHIRALRENGVDARFSVGAPIDFEVCDAITVLPASAWSSASDADDEIRDGAQVDDLTGQLDSTVFLDGPRFIVRRKRPTPEPSWTCSTLSKASDTSSSPLTAMSAAARWGSLTPATAPMPASMTTSAPGRTPALAASLPAKRTSVPPDSNSL